MTSAELRRIVEAMTERPWCVIQFRPEHGGFADSYPLVVTDPGDDGRRIAACDGLLRTHEDAAAIATLANHATALVALLEACERRRDARCWSRWPQDDTNIHDCLCGRISDASECPVTSSDRAIMAALASVHATP